MIDTKTAIEKITNGEFDNLFTDIYIDSSMIDYQKKRYVHAIEQYETIFCPDKVAIFSAPGRSEVCGNHTDHQHGMVLATSINLDTIAVSAKNNNDVVRFVSDGYDMITLNINDLEVNDDEAGTTVSLIRGVLRGLKDHGYKIGGFNAYATSDVLVGAGLSSSAAFEVVVGTIISGLYNEIQLRLLRFLSMLKMYFSKSRADLWIKWLVQSEEWLTLTLKIRQNQLLRKYLPNLKNMITVFVLLTQRAIMLILQMIML